MLASCPTFVKIMEARIGPGHRTSLAKSFAGKICDIRHQILLLIRSEHVRWKWWKDNRPDCLCKHYLATLNVLICFLLIFPSPNAASALATKRVEEKGCLLCRLQPPARSVQGIGN